VITSLDWLQHRLAWDGVRIGTIAVINPRPNQYWLVTGNCTLAALTTDGADEAEDLANAKTLCRLHYQQSFSEDT
jgi:hypothetical protein